MKTKTATTRIISAIRAIIRAAIYAALVLIAGIASIACLCSFDPEQPGFVCDRPGLCMASGLVIFMSVATIIGMATSGSNSKTLNSKL